MSSIETNNDNDSVVGNNNQSRSLDETQQNCPNMATVDQNINSPALRTIEPPPLLVPLVPPPAPQQQQHLDQEMSESLDQLSTLSYQSSASSTSGASSAKEEAPLDSDDDEYRKQVRVGNHYQARIPKLSLQRDNTEEEGHTEDKLLWNPLHTDSATIDGFLKHIGSQSKLLIPMGSHVRDNEIALYMLQQNNHDIERTTDYLVNGKKRVETAPKKDDDSQTNKISERVLEDDSDGGAEMSAWTEEECRNFENGMLSFGKNFFLIQKYKVSTRAVRDLVQFYYLWKKTERYDVLSLKMRAGKRKYMINPGISDLMIKYFGHGVTTTNHQLTTNTNSTTVGTPDSGSGNNLGRKSSGGVSEGVKKNLAAQNHL